MQSVLTNPPDDFGACQNLEPLIMDRVPRGGSLA